MAINNINSWERWGFLTGLCFVVSRRNSAKKDSRSEGRERAEEWEIQRNTKTERAGCDLNPRLGKKESHALWIMHTHNTHIWSIQFLLPISEDKYDGCKLHTVNLVFHIVYMRWVSTPVNYSTDYSELPFINKGCGCLVGLIHESSPPSRVISRLFGFFLPTCEGGYDISILNVLSPCSDNLCKFSQANVLMTQTRAIITAHCQSSMQRAAWRLCACYPACKPLHVASPRQNTILGYCPRWRRHACCWRLCRFCYWHPSSVQKKKKGKKGLQGWLCFLSHQITMNRLFEENVPRQLNPTQLLVAVQIQNLAAVESLTEDAHAGVQQV